nr:hypothetical protein [Tanacetum cinerariifolium]
MYVSGPIDIFDMVDIDLFTVVALNMMVLKLGYIGGCSLSWAPLEEINDEPAGSIAVIDDVMRQLSFDETKSNEEAGFTDVAESGANSSRLSHDESFGVDELDLNLKENHITQEHILAEVSIQKPIMAEVSTQEPVVAEVSTEYNGEFNESAHSNGQFFFDDEEIDSEYDVQSSEDAVSDDVLEGKDVDVINPDGFDSDPGNYEETNYRKRRLAELRTEMKGVINASGQWKRNLKLYKNDGVRIRDKCNGKVPIFTMSHNDGPTIPNRVMKPGPSGSNGLTIRSKKRKNTGTNADSQASSFGLDAHDKGDLFPWVLVNPDILVKAVQDQLQRELEVQISMSKTFRAKAKAERQIIRDHSTNPNTTVKIVVERNNDPSLPTRVFQRIYVCLGALKLGFKACRRDLLGLDGAFMKGTFSGQCLGYDIDLHPNSYFTFISDRQKGIIPAIKTMYPSAEHIYCLRNIHESMKHGWCRQACKDLLWRATSATNFRDFEKYRAKFDLLLNNICEVFNGKIVGGRDKPVITLLEYIREYCMKRIVNVQGVIDK